MSAEAVNDKYSIKNLLFYRAIPNYKPESTDGHALYSCTDCGDRFILESSYQYHINRKSVQITYKCRHCSPRIVFYNRCNLLSHIRSHTFKTATINVSDLKIDPLPLSFYKSIKNDDIANTAVTGKQKQKHSNNCFECQKDITSVGPIYKDRANHCMEYTNKVFSCPVCLFNLPTSCGLKAHLRIHLKIPPYYCPECGVHMSNKNIFYPFNHSCEGFNMMRATTRHLCPEQNCISFHPNDYKVHMKDKHLKKIFSCPGCGVACFNESTMQKHINTAHEQKHTPLLFYKCAMCPGRLVMQNHVESHLSNHRRSCIVYPCWFCNKNFKDVPNLINHHIVNHEQNEELKNCLKSFVTTKRNYRVVKQCDQCKRNFMYKCHYDEINTLPNACPFKCVAIPKSLLKKGNSTENTETKIKCPLCKNKINESWVNVKNHFAIHHKEQRCMDAIICLPRTSDSLKKYLKKVGGKRARNNFFLRRTKKPMKEIKRRPGNNNKKELIKVPDNNLKVNSHICGKCQEAHDTKETLEAHIIENHRDPTMAYQCMECGDCFVVKPSFSIHMLFHGISDVDEYIKNKKCYDPNAHSSTLNDFIEKPLDENQCKICRERFDDPDQLKKHFRVHGMAFLKNNTLK